MAVPGTTENGSAAASTGQSGASQPAVSSGTASEAMIAAAQAASSADTSPGGATGDTSGQPSTGTAGSTTSAATGPAGQKEPSGTAPAKPGQQPPASGQAPDHRIQTAVTNARAEGRREAEAQYAVFKGMDPEQVRAGLELLQDLRRDPAAFVREVNARIQQQTGGGGNEPIEEYPEADLVSTDGKLKTYSHATHLKSLEIHGKKVTAQIMKELEPFLKFTRGESERREAEQAETARVTRVDEALKEVRTRKHFTKENEPAILEILSGIEDKERMKADPAWALNFAYNKFLDERIFPTIDTTAEQRVRESFAKKAAATAGSVNPSGPVGEGKPVEIKGQDGLARHMEKLAAEMSV